MQFKLKKFKNKVRFLEHNNFVEAEAERVASRIKANSEAEIAKIETERKVAAKEAQKRMEDIENQIYIDKEKAKADANHYSLMRMIEAE